MACLRDNANIGRRLRELRLERGLQQADVARTLGVSGAYLNLLEKGKRTVQLPLLWKALSFFGIEMEAFMASLGERRAPDALAKLLDEPLLRSLGITNEDILDFSGEPKRTAMLVALFNLYKNTRTQLEQVATRLAEEQQDGAGVGTFEKARLSYSPMDEITDFLQSQRNYFAELEDEARRIRFDHKLGRRILSDELVKILKARKVRVDFVPPGKGSVVRRYDPKKRQLTMSTALLEQPTKFQLAATIGLRVLDESALDERLAKAFGPKHAETPRLMKIHLANYFAGALLLPYEDFIGEVERTRYDIELLVEPVRDVLRGGRAPRVQPRRSQAAGHPAALRPLRRRRQHLQALLGDGPALPRGVGLVREVGRAQRVSQPVGADAAVLDDARRRDLLLLRAGDRAAAGGIARPRHDLLDRPRHPRRRRAPPRLRAGHAVHRRQDGDPHRRELPLLRAHRLQPARGAEPEVPFQRRRVHEKGQFLLSARRHRPLRVGPAGGSLR